MTGWLEPLRRALESGEEELVVFVRDDDAGWEDDRLLALLDVAGRHGACIDLAAIPRALTPGLAGRLVAERDAWAGRLGIHQHGYAHVDHEPEGRKCEFGPSRPAAEQSRDIEHGAALLATLLGATDPIFTPPWNRCTRATGEALVAAGFHALSRESRAAPLGVPGLAELPVDVDWFAKRKGVPLGREGVGDLLGSAAAAPGPLGLMLHHAAMDDDDLAAAGALLGLLAGHPRVRFAPMRELIPSG